MRDSFIFERLWVEAIKKIENENTQLALYNAICNYGLYGTETIFKDDKLNALFYLIKVDLDRVNIPFDYKKDRTCKEYQKWRKAVLERDNYTCQMCGSKEKLHVHHIRSFKDYSDLRFDIKNGVVLCKNCHLRVHKRRK